MSGFALASYKVNLPEGRIRAVPSRDEAGCAFAGPGVDVRFAPDGPLARAIDPVMAWLVAREPGVELRTISVDLRRRRVLVTLAPERTSSDVDLPFHRTKPRVLRFDAPYAEELIDAAKPLQTAIADDVRAVLARRT